MEKKGDRFIVAGIGELLWDELPAGRRLGGAPANFAYHAQALGARSFVISATGDDEAGRDIRSELNRKDLDTAHVSLDPDHPTGSVSVRVDADGVPEYTIVENVAWDFIPQTTDQIELAARTDAVCFGSLAQRSSVSQACIHAFLDATRPECLRVFDLSLRLSFYTIDVITESLGRANVLKLNDDELTILSRALRIEGDPKTLLDTLATRYELHAIALTLGDSGCVVQKEGQVVTHRGFPLDSLGDTVGAGDCFTAVLTMGLLNNEPLELIAERANRLAAYVCTQGGAMPEMP